MNQTEARPLTGRGAPKRGAPAVRSLALILGVAPLLAFMTVFFFWPLWDVVIRSLQDNFGNPSAANYIAALKEPYISAFRTSIELGLLSAVSSSIPGAILAYIIETQGGSQLRKVISSISGVLANTGGVPLAFMFIAAFGAEGSATALLKAFGLDIYAGNFTLFSFGGLILVYTYFQIPMMVIVFSPAVHGIRREWKEAAQNLGASRLQFWRLVGVPLLFPSFIASFLLLFAAAFSAFATARAMTTGTVALVPLMIGSLVDGNVINDQVNLGKALAVSMVIVAALAMVPYLIIQRRAEKWQNR